MSTRFCRGKSTPAIRAMNPPSLTVLPQPLSPLTPCPSPPLRCAARICDLRRGSRSGLAGEECTGVRLSLPLVVLANRAYDSHDALAADHFTLFTTLLYGRF